jgi:hypothetical protein
MCGHILKQVFKLVLTLQSDLVNAFAKFSYLSLLQQTIDHYYLDFSYGLLLAGLID